MAKKIKKKQKQKQRKRTKNLVKEKKDIEPNYYLGNHNIVEQPDGSKGWHNIRDHGRFGSFPSFEPMDDE